MKTENIRYNTICSVCEVIQIRVYYMETIRDYICEDCAKKAMETLQTGNHNLLEKPCGWSHGGETIPKHLRT